MFKFLRNIALTTGVLFIIFLGVLIFVSAIPSQIVNSSLGNSVETLKKEGLYPSVGFPWRKIVLDNFTDGVMLNIAYSVDSTDPVQSAIRNIQHDGNDNSADQILNLEKMYQQKGIHETVYERYWHGYLIFLRPLLTVTSYAGVRVVLTVALFSIFAVFMLKSWKQLDAQTTVGLLSGFIAVDFFWLGKSIQLSNTFLTGMVGALYLLRQKKASFLTVSTVFFIVGAVTQYIDVLSAPLVSLGLLLVVAADLLKKTIDLKKIIFLCALWFIGYSSLWGAKWMLAEYTYVPGAINIGYKKVQDRTMNSVDTQFSRKNAVLRNFYQLRGYDKRDKIVLLVLGMCYAVFMARYFSMKLVHKQKVVMWLAVAVIPYLWYFIAAEHSYIHVLFTYRNQFITVVSGFLISAEFINWKRVEKDVMAFVQLS